MCTKRISLVNHNCFSHFLARRVTKCRRTIELPPRAVQKLRLAVGDIEESEGNASDISIADVWQSSPVLSVADSTEATYLNAAETTETTSSMSEGSRPPLVVAPCPGRRSFRLGRPSRITERFNKLRCSRFVSSFSVVSAHRYVFV